MFIGTHVLLPVTLAMTVDIVRQARGRDEVFPGWSIPLIGLIGALPDLCSPHLSLEARYSSWSHTLLFLALLLPACAWLCGFFPKGSRLLVLAGIWMAAVLHLGGDAVAGGIPWLLPWRDHILGAYYIHPDYWLLSDGAFVVITWILLGTRRYLRLRV